ncbi:MAG: pyrroloquinoline-quinone synthase PqqC [Gammaproteobacteria bacterium]|nr:pyrroloquinoline-quinone synthase PqqC [Gammaproteobacteria bacterium]
MATDQSSETLEMRLRAIGSRRYHDQHPFHKDLHAGNLNKQQIQAWALNRYCYQAVIPKKDAAIMARIDDPMLRTIWRQRVIDHDGDGSNSGGINRWLKLTDSLGLDRDYVISQEGALPATQFAVSAYLNFVTDNSLLEAIASSLTEMFSPRIIAERVSGMLANYDFVTEETMAYFKPRLSQAPRDVDFALAYVLEHADSIEKQDKVAAALTFKCNVLWSQLDALYGAYIEPGMIPPGCFTPTLTKPA